MTTEHWSSTTTLQSAKSKTTAVTSVSGGETKQNSSSETETDKPCKDECGEPNFIIESVEKDNDVIDENANWNDTLKMSQKLGSEDPKSEPIMIDSGSNVIYASLLVLLHTVIILIAMFNV